MSRPFVIWAWSFDDSSGGMVALHLLCHRLNAIGERALLWDAQRPVLRHGVRPRDWLRFARWSWARRNAIGWRNLFDSPLARSRDLAGAIAIYPEVVAGDPLGTGRAVRWLLHRPGHHSGVADYGSDDLFFFYQEAFADPAFDIDSGNRLTMTWFIDAYRQTNHGERAGSCYLLRKGAGRPIVHELAGSIQVDDMSHEERASVFNRTRYFYCYDLYTMYALYAALCGCIPIVVPDPALAKREWVPDERDTFGIAYGEGDVAWAIETRERLIARLASLREEQDAGLRTFVAKCRARFG